MSSTPPKNPPTGDDDDNKPFSLGSSKFKDEEGAKLKVANKDRENVRLTLDADEGKNARINFAAAERTRQANLKFSGAPAGNQPSLPPLTATGKPGKQGKDKGKDLSSKKSEDDTKDDKLGMSGRMTWYHIGMLGLVSAAATLAGKWFNKEKSKKEADEGGGSKLAAGKDKKDKDDGSDFNPNFSKKLGKTAEDFNDGSKNPLGKETFTPDANNAAASAAKQPIRPAVEPAPPDPAIDSSPTKKTDELSSSKPRLK